MCPNEVTLKACAKSAKKLECITRNAKKMYVQMHAQTDVFSHINGFTLYSFAIHVSRKFVFSDPEEKCFHFLCEAWFYLHFSRAVVNSIAL